MKVLILKGDSPRHNYFAKRILDIKGLECEVISHHRLGNTRLRKMFFKSPSTFFNRVSKYFFQKLRGWKKKEELFFGMAKLDQEIKVENLNSIESLRIMKDFAPDLLLAFGIPIISNKVIGIPKYGAINLHGGISPEYKGGNTIFWALYNKDFTKTGATIHYMVKKVDSGDIIAKIYPDIGSNDNEFTVSCKTFEYATTEIMNIVKWIKTNKKRVPGIKQEGKGHLYLAKHRTFVKDLFGPIRIKRSLKNVSIPKKIERFY